MDIKITEYGTVKWSERDGSTVYYGDTESYDEYKYHEMSVNSFLKKLTKKINKGGPYLSDDNKVLIDYEADVYADGEDKYRILFADSKWSLSNTHYLCIKDAKEYYPTLKTTLDEFVEITKKHELESECVDKCENDNNPSVADFEIYLNSLKRVSKDLSILKAIIIGLPIFGLIGTPSGIILGRQQEIWSIMKLFLFLLSLTSCCSVAASFLWMVSIGWKGILQPFKSSKIIKLKIKKIKNLLVKRLEAKSKVTNELEKPIVKKDLYKNSIINYMSTIMTSANKLNSHDRKQKLLELRDILDDYTARCQQLQNSNTTELTLEHSERTIVLETLDKLTALEMEIAEIIRYNTEIDKKTSESDDLRKKIDEYLAIVSDEEAELSINKSKNSEKIRVRTMQ